MSGVCCDLAEMCLWALIPAIAAVVGCLRLEIKLRKEGIFKNGKKKKEE